MKELITYFSDSRLPPQRRVDVGGQEKVYEVNMYKSNGRPEWPQ